jgi:hypothetical protein
LRALEFALPGALAASTLWLAALCAVAIRAGIY